MIIKQISELYGRQISNEYLDDHLIQKYSIKFRAAINVDKKTIVCQRCGQKTPRKIAKLPNKQYYCPECINLGRTSTLHSLCTVSEPNYFNTFKDEPLTWHGHLTVSQVKCSKKIIDIFKSNAHHLLWAVTGAGKTEMLFNGINWGLKHKKRIAIASPRVDVCMELYPRFQEAFSNVKIALLHGKQKEKYQYCQLTICTTHQLLRFYHAFDILIIDEVDSFPFINNNQLHYAALNAIKNKAATLYLTATPDKSLLKKVKHHKISISYLPIRYHGHLLPEIKLHFTPNWRKKLKHYQIPLNVKKIIKQNIESKRRFLLFVPHVNDLKPIAKIISGFCNINNFMTVHSEDKERLVKVKMMREHQIQFLITTTILERGVTFPEIDVIVLGAEDDVFSSSSLVQIAGRVGRSKSRPTGNVDFMCHTNTKCISEAVRQVKHMNYLGRKIIDQRK